MEKFSSSRQLVGQEQTSENLSPHNSDFADEVAQDLVGLSDAKRALLGMKLAAKHNDSRSEIPRLPRHDHIPLSRSQEALWFLDQFEPNNNHYNEPVAFRLLGSLNLEPLQEAIDFIVFRHEVLRTTFTAVDGVPAQLVSPVQPLKLRMIDLSQVPTDEREEKIQELLKEETRRLFNLSSDLMLRVVVLKLGPEEHILLLVMHHIVSDGWSMGILYRELSALYEAFSQGKPSPLPDLPIQYADFAVWQREWLQGEVLERQISYWKEQLAGIPAVLNLPTDHPRPTVQSYRGAWRSIRLSKELTEAVKTLSRKEGVTLFMTLLAAFQTLLYRYTGQEDIVVGSPIANRNRAEIEGLIGFFVNTLVLRTKFDGDPTFKELLVRVREMALGAYAHQDLPFEKLVEERHPERSLNHTPLFQVMFVLQNAPTMSLNFGGLRTTAVPISTETAKFDLTLFVSETGGELSGSIEYNSDLFDSDTIERLSGNFQTLLQGIIENPEQRISHLPLLTQAEQHQLLIDRNDTQKGYPRDKCIHELFEAQVEQSPDAVAVTFEGERLSYRELNARANQLARHLIKNGVGPEVVVGICMERSLEMMVGLLGILKAGGAYMPLDPNYPNERLAFMLEDTHAAVLVSQTRMLTYLPESCARIVCLDRDYGEIAHESSENTISGATAQNLAYVIYTSGSTGQPKGVEVLHRGVLRLVFEVDYVQVGVNETFLHLSPDSFDASTFEIWGALLNGAKCVFFPGKIPSPNEIASTLRHHEISTLWLTASLFNTIIDEAPETLSSVRQLLIGGEALSVAHVRRALALLPHTQIINGYGPTESTTFACCYPIPVQLDDSVSSIPIGRPIANTEVYLLDSQLSPVPIGVAGELYIGGDGLARGYLNRPELTAEKFIAHPFKKDGARLYKTGDVARYRSDGNIEFLGRMDHQVKVRGYRIEAGEIESALGQHPEVREAVVLARVEDSLGDPSTGRRLVAYVVPRREPAPTITELKNYLKQKLPPFMIPSAFVLLNTLPLTANGKIDRRALPAPDQSRPEIEESYVAPLTPEEQLLAEIWAEVLKLEKVGIHDNFFELGGHSLLATQAISRIQRMFKVELPLRALFERPTVAELANRVEEIRGKERRLPASPIVAYPRDRDLPLSFSQQRLWFLDQYEPNSSVYNIPGVVRLKGSLDVAALERSLNEIIRRHESLRTTFSIVEGEPVQLIAPFLRISLAVVDLRNRQEGKSEEDLQRLVKEESRRPFDLSRGPLFRATLVRPGDEDYILVLLMHHIVSDGWSMGILYRELSALYEAFSQGKPSPLPDLPIQYADFALGQRNWLLGEILQSQLSYWKKQLEGAPGGLTVPTDHPRPAVQSYRGACRSITLSKELTEALEVLSRKEGVTLFMTLLAGFQTLLHRYTGEDDVVVGSPIANRNRPETERLIGFFINTLVLRTNFAGHPTFKELLARVREIALGAYAHQDLPFEKLVEELQPERSLSHSPLFQVMFNMFNQEDPRLGFPGLTTERFPFSEPQSKFDLTMYARKQEDGIHFDLVYRADLFSAARMTCFVDQYKYLLEQMACAPEKPIRSFSLVTPESRSMLPDPGVALASPPQELVTSRIFAWAKQMPINAAICQGPQSWTYEELTHSADILARQIVATGLVPGEVVAVHGKPSFGLIAAMIATLLSGGVLLPLDPNLPMQRKQRMLMEAKAKRLLYVGSMEPDDAWLEETVAVAGLVVDPQKGCAIKSETEKDQQQHKLPAIDLDDPAYVFFTSGSTGVPKGILGRHKGLSHFLVWQRETFAIGPGDRVAQLTGLSFDAVLRDIFLPLTSGATLCLPHVDDALDSTETIEWLDQQRITVLHAVPSLAQSWVAGKSATHLGSLRWAFFMGEPLTEAFVRSWRSATGPAGEIINFYGPTETTLIKCYYRVPDEMTPGVQPVGSPIPDTQVLILSGDNQLCGINEPGEIVLRTPFGTLGYINAPEENEKRFVKNPFRDDPEDIVYFTGDTGCYRPDGSVQIFGRRDDQVKIRGVRIDPEEVTATLASHPLVYSCVVVGKKNTRGESYLAAYVVAAGEEAPSRAELRSYLLARLPAAMVPSDFFVLDGLPLTPNGKIDRQRLPEPVQRTSEPEDSYIPPRTEIETIIAAIWTRVLKREKIGVYDNFFDLGGHSLLATQIISRLREALQAEISLRVVFEKPTVAGLSDHIEMIRPTRGATKVIDPLDEIEEITL
jgi:amino acid adenylation domain-containing protein